MSNTIPTIHPTGRFSAILENVTVFESKKVIPVFGLHFQSQYGKVVCNLYGSERGFWEQHIVDICESYGLPWNYEETGGVKIGEALKNLIGRKFLIKVQHQEDLGEPAIIYCIARLAGAQPEESTKDNVDNEPLKPRVAYVIMCNNTIRLVVKDSLASAKFQMDLLLDDGFRQKLKEYSKGSLSMEDYCTEFNWHIKTVGCI